MRGKECVTGFSCPIEIRLILPKDCLLDEEALKKRIEENGAKMFMGLCDACPYFHGKDKR